MSSLIVEVSKVEDIFKHPNADRLSIVKIKGWNVIVGLNEYKVGDLVTYIPPDSIIPDNLIEKYNLEYLKSNGRLRTVKLRGYISQGLVLPLPDGNWNEGDNLSEYLGITKWEPPTSSPTMKGARQVSKKRINPYFDKYTDIENIKNYNTVFKNGDWVVITEKIHGANFRAGRLPISDNKNQPIFYRIRNWFKRKFLKQTHEFVWGSHNVQITHHENRNNYYGDDIWGRMVEKYHLENIIPDDYILYGEVYGNGIQDLVYGLSDIDLVIFDIKHDGKYLDWYDTTVFCYDWGIPTVPFLYQGPFSEDILNECTNGMSMIDSNQIKEGCVVKSLKEDNDPRIGRKILKSINAEYLLRKNGTEFK